MEVTRPCVSCGKFNSKVENLDLGDTKNWFVKCENCIGITTITHAVRDEAIRQWNNQWCWSEIDRLFKQVQEANIKEQVVRVRQVEDQQVLQFRYEKLADEYIKYRMLYSGTAGNINLEERRNLMKKELSQELGWTL